jgi:hypothetical protein
MTTLTPKRRKIAVECTQPVNRNDFTERCVAEHVFGDVDRNGPKGVLRNDAFQQMILECSQMNTEEVANNPERHKIYRRKKCYAVDIFRGRVRLIDPGTSFYISAHLTPNCLVSRLPYLSENDLFDAIQTAHMESEHGGRDATVKMLSNRYCNVSKQAIMIFIRMCEPCERKRNKQERKIVYQPITSKNYNARVQVDLIDWQSVSETGEFKHILTYE